PKPCASGGEYSCVMARYTLVYGLRLVPEGTLTGADEGRLKLKGGTEAGLTLHTIDGTIPQLRRALDRSLDAFFDLLPGAADEDGEQFGEWSFALEPGRRCCERSRPCVSTSCSASASIAELYASRRIARRGRSQP